MIPLSRPGEVPERDPLSARAAATPDATALIDVETDREWTYAAFDRRVDRVARVLGELGDGEPPPDRLGVLMDTRPAFAVVFFAAVRTGTTVVPLNVRETVPELADKVERTSLEAIVCERGTESTAVELADRAGGCSVASADDPERVDDGVRSLDVLEDGDATDAAPEPDTRGRIDPETTQLIMFTSGTSGDPKGVELTLANLVASATASAFRLGVDPADRWLCCLPMYHMGGLAPVIRSTLYGTTVVIQREFTARETAHVLEEYDVTGVSLVPTMCKRLLECDRGSDGDGEDGWQPPDTLRFVLLGGAPATDDLLERCLDRGVPVHPTYGMTETASQIATATPDEVRRYEGTVGRPLVGTEVSVVDDDGDPVEPGEPGELVVAGPTVTPGYLEPAVTEAAFDERGLHTGDVGYRDEGGRLRILNRRSDRIVTGGENVDPGEVVDALLEHPAVDEAAVVGLPDEEWGERVSALLVPTGDDLEYASVLTHCDDRLAGFKRPKTLAVADELPRTASGTVDRDAVRKRLLEDGLDAAHLEDRAGSGR
ncbi:2-succinylbenzoate-CoA ligase [Halobiforma lacisalsi AJ5]|uniref:2-succinylbenzoate-CoA ligase n=1 Tax=Natronobacterium lacisalsi AJ5 TaxID=358396 RepID=M0LDX4_NATLA|nr:class I adenylate-forming enzyme family protein [Halobiforma lacisalsi]APW99050.1 2-succinylbenzoate-CoA ligase [Halobiforma lacisalsi AJ5]EMA31313.1 o-succinylbenzoate--CoA ligase [Halobiforma lacisalsi AJ5]